MDLAEQKPPDVTYEVKPSRDRSPVAKATASHPATDAGVKRKRVIAGRQVRIRLSHEGDRGPVSVTTLGEARRRARDWLDGLWRR